MNEVGDGEESRGGWLPTASMTLVSLISYIDRNTLAILGPTILAETKLSAQEYAWIISTFSVAYMLANPFWGRVLDRFGVRRGMLIAVSLWSLASASHALARGFAGFALARGLLGFGEGATFPGGLRTASLVLAARHRARGIALAYSGGSLGAIVTPLIVTPVALAFGWRAAFACTGAIGAAWLLFFFLIASRDPRLADPVTAVREPRPGFADGRLWAFLAAYSFGALPLALVLYGAPLYLTRVHHFTQSTLGKVLWLPPLGWEIGYFFWGTVADRTRAIDLDASQAFRRGVALLVLLSMPLALVPLIESTVVLLALLVFAMFVSAAFVIVPISYATRVFSTRHAAYLGGLGAGSWSALVAVVMPFFGALFDRGKFGTAFVVATSGPVVALVLVSTLLARRRS